MLSLFELACSAALTAWILISHRDSRWAEVAAGFASNPWAQSLVYAAFLAALFSAIDLPFGFWRSQVLEKRYGLTTQSAGDWAKDLVKGLLLGGTLGAVIVSGLVGCIEWGARGWWWMAAGAATVFGVVLTRLAPQLLIPVFFKMRPLADAALAARFTALAQKTETPLLGVYEIDLSRRTRAANAAVVGFGASRRALVGDTLLAEFSPDEIEFVLAHELGHHRYHDLWTGIALGAALTTVSCFVADRTLVALGTEIGRDPFTPAQLFWIALLMTVLGKLTAPLQRYVSRLMETRADAFAAAATVSPASGAASFRKLGFQNLAVFDPPAWEEALLHTHPSIGRRIRRLEAAAPEREVGALRELDIASPQLRALYTRIGGETGLERILVDFYGRMSRDTMIGFFFESRDLAAIARMQKHFLMRAWGASPSYSGRAPADAHTALAPILSGHFDRRLTILEETLRDYGLADADVALWASFENKFRDAVLKSRRPD